MNTYMVHMLERAREVHEINFGETGRDSILQCPFCIADEDEQWFKTRDFGLSPPKSRPEKMPAPHCRNCPLLSVTKGSHRDLMNDCVEMGKQLLNLWEGPDD